MERKPVGRVHDGATHSRRPESATATQLLQRKIAQAELQLRELEDETKRAVDQQEKEIELLRRENATYHERVEQLRLESYRPPPLQAATTTAEDGDADTTHDTTRAQPPLSSLLLSRNPVYRAARDKAARLRVECAEAESRLATTRHTLTALRQRAREGKLRSHDAALQAAMSMSVAQSMSGNTRDRLRALEVHVSTEVERLCGVLAEAKSLRRHVDDLLITQTRFERDCGRRERELLLKKREMAFLMEVCSVLCEERAQCETEVRELQEQVSEELTRYEVAFRELNAVQVESEREQEQQAAALQQLREEVKSMRKERAALEKENETKQMLIGAIVQSAAHPGDRPRDARRCGAEHSFDTAPKKCGPARRCGGGGVASNNVTALATITSCQVGGGGDAGAEPEVAEYARCYEHLVKLVGTNELDGLVRFITESAEDRYGDFHVVNDLDSRIDQLEKEIKGMEEPSRRPAAATATGVQNDDTDSICVDGQEGATDVTVTDGHPSKDNMLATLRATLAAQSLCLRTQQCIQQHHDKLFAMVLDIACQLWSGMGCNVAQLRQLTGYDDCTRASLNACLGLIENRVEECLLLLARRANGNNGTNTARHDDAEPRVFAGSNTMSVDIAQALLKRRDLAPRQESGPARIVAEQRLPYSSDEGLAPTPTSALKQDKQSQPMSIVEMKALISGQRG